jgi:hypothetical protein
VYIGRFLLEERETWYFGGGSSMDSAAGVREDAIGFFRDDSVLGFDVVDEGFGMSSALVLRVFIRDDAGAFFRADWVLPCDAGDPLGRTSSTFFVVLELFPWWDGNSGFGSGGWALSDSVTASAAARSAAREASCGVVGVAGGACDGAVGFADCTGSILKLASHYLGCSAYYEDILSAHNLVAVEKRKCCRHVTVRGAASGLSKGIHDCMRGILSIRGRIEAIMYGSIAVSGDVFPKFIVRRQHQNFSVIAVAGVFATHSHFSYCETPPPPADDKEIRARSHHDGRYTLRHHPPWPIQRQMAATSPSSTASSPS